MKKYRLFGLSLLITFLLIGCSGSSSEDDTTQIQDESTQTGVVVDSQIIGLRYLSTNKDKTQTKKGITNLKGEFEYFENGTTEFFVGNIKIADTIPRKMVAITTIAKTDKEAENIARFLQTIDEDGNPDNGIKIPASIDSFSKRNDVSTLKFDDTFDTNFEIIKPIIFQEKQDIPATVSVAQALRHSSKSERLSSLNEFDLYKAIANEKNYRGGDYYNYNILENDPKNRVYLWIWEKLLLKEMAIEDELQFTKPEFDINNVEEVRNQLKKYIDYADVVTGIASLGEGTYKNILKAGTRTFGYEVTKLTSLTVGGCSTVVKLYDANTNDSIELSDDNLCKNIMKILNPVGDSTSRLAVVNPILSSFLPKVLPKLLHAKKMNWLHFNTKSLRTISRLNLGKLSKANLASIALSILSISNDFYGASWASDINEELTTRIVAREWLSILFRSGFKQDYMNKLINNNSKVLKGNKEQIEAIALKLGSTGALCDTYEFFNPFYKCTGIENINYNFDKVVSIINEKLAKSNALYRNITDLTGSISDGKGQIGVVEINWIKPKATPQTISTSKNTQKSITLSASDDDNDALTYTVVTNPTNGSLSGTAPNLIYTPNTDYTGSDSFTFKVNDGISDSDIVSVSIDVDATINTPPVANAGINQELSTGSSVFLTAEGSTDADGDTLTYAWSFVSKPAGSTAILTGSTLKNTSFIADKAGVYSLKLKVNDTLADSLYDAILIRVNDSAVTTYTWLVSAWTECSGECGTDIATQTRTATCSSSEGATVDNSMCSIDTKPTTTQSCTASICAQNTAPIATAQSITVAQDSANNDITLSATDADGDTLIYSIVDDVTHGTVTITDNIAEYTPSANFSGEDSFSFKVNDGTDDSNTATLTINVTQLSETISHNGVTYSTVTSPYTARIWLDRNLGASQACTALDDTACYGDYYQWGRNTDGHQLSTSATNTAQATDINSVGHSDFITSTNTYDYDWAQAADSDGSLRAANWSKTDGSSVCPVGFRVPTEQELRDETLDNTGGDAFANNTDAYDNFLKLPSAGSRGLDGGSMYGQGSYGIVWSSSVSGSYSRGLRFYSSDASTSDGYRAYGFSVRCLRD